MIVLTEGGSKLTIVSPPELATFIHERKMDVSAYFLTEARKSVPAAADKSTSFLLDHLPQVIEAIAGFIRAGGADEAKSRAIEFAKKHAIERLGGQRYSADQIRKEYAIVREGILDLLGRETLLDQESLKLFTEICELTLAIVIEVFVSHGQQGLQ